MIPFLMIDDRPVAGVNCAGNNYSIIMPHESLNDNHGLKLLSWQFQKHGEVC